MEAFKKFTWRYRGNSQHAPLLKSVSGTKLLIQLQALNAVSLLGSY